MLQSEFQNFTQVKPKFFTCTELYYLIIFLNQCLHYSAILIVLKFSTHKVPSGCLFASKNTNKRIFWPSNKLPKYSHL